MLLVPGFAACIQSKKEIVSKDLLARSEYQLLNLRGPLAGTLQPTDWETTKNGIIIHTYLGQPMRSRFEWLAEGSKQWRYTALSLGILDEFAFGIEDEATYATALSCVEGGDNGKLAIFSTGAFNTYFNREILAMAERNGWKLWGQSAPPVTHEVDVA